VIPWFRQITELKPNLPSLIKFSEVKTKKVSVSLDDEKLDIEVDVDEEGNTIKKRTQEEKDEMVKMLNMINLGRFKDHHNWITLCFMIKGNGLSKELFIKISENSGFENYNEDICLNKWSSIIPNENKIPGFGVLGRWLEEDNISYRSSPKDESESISKKVLNDMIEYLKNQKHITHLNISEIFYKYYSKDYYFTDVGWIKYDDTKGWVKGDDELIIIPLMKQFGKVLMDYAIKCEKEDNKKEIPENPKVKDLQEKIDGLCDDIFDIGNDQEHKDEPCIIASGHNEKIILLMKKETDKKNKDKKKEVEKINKEKQRRREKCKKEIDRYESLKQKEIEKYNNKVSKEEDKEKNAWINKLKDNASDLQNLPNIMSCIKTLRAKCKDNSILNELDVLHPEIFPFSDMKGFNLDTGEVIDIQREHKILSHAGYPLPERKQDEVDFATEYFNSFLLPDQLDNYISVIVQSLYGKNKNQIIGFLLGEGSNGKSFTKDYILKPIFGELFGVLPSTQLTKKDTGKDQANSALSSCMGKRMVMINEPPSDAQNKEPFIISTIKEMTGDIMMKVRDLHSKAFNMYITFTPYVCLNSFPPLSSNDSAIERRIECLYHRIIFKDKNDLDYDPTNQFQKLKNEEFTKLVISKRNGILWYLLESYFKNKGQIIRSDENIQKKLEIMTDNNPLKDFLTGYRKSETFIRSKVLHTKYSSNNKNQQLNAKEFNKFLRIMQTIMEFQIDIDDNHGNKIYLEAIPFQDIAF
jgi:phage/plasmid-associated DNA primase